MCVCVYILTVTAKEKRHFIEATSRARRHMIWGKLSQWNLPLNSL